MTVELASPRNPDGESNSESQRFAGLILLVKETGAKSWVQRLTIRGRRRDLGLGPYPLVTLGEARQAAYDNRKLALARGGPREMRAKRLIPTFREAAAAVIEMHSPNWRNAKSVTSWESTLKSYAYPKIGSMPVDAIEPADVMRCLLPIWNTKRETARKVRQRIGTVMKWAIAEGHRKDNPAGDAIGAALPKVGTRRHTARDNARRGHGGAAEGAQVQRAQFDEARLRVPRPHCVPVTRGPGGNLGRGRSGRGRLNSSRRSHETGSEHRVPLSDRAMAVFKEARAFRENDLLFPTATGRTMSDSILSKLLRELGIGAVPHGFRSTFRDWCGGMTNAPREVAGAALGHKVGNILEQAYARSDLFEKRRALMESWARYLGRRAGDVIELTRMA